MITIRETFENREKTFISPYGCLSSASKGRKNPEKPCDIRTVFQQDRDRIIYSNAFRRLKYKTQVFLSPLGDEYRTRLTHTLEVAQIGRNIARAMRLNEDLAEAIALGHDLGHPPFGHSGETALNEILNGQFSHHRQGLRIVDILENNGKGLNLTFETRDGILKHSKGYGKILPDDPGELAATTEGRIVRVADIMAYLNHDLDDALRSGVITREQIPRQCIDTLGKTHSERAGTMIRDIINNSYEKNKAILLKTSEKVSFAMGLLRNFLYENVYRSKQVHNEFIKAKKIIIELYQYFWENDDKLQQELERTRLFKSLTRTESKERIICDFLACMTDRYALNLYSKLFLPSPTF